MGKEKQKGKTFPTKFPNTEVMFSLLRVIARGGSLTPIHELKQKDLA